MATALDVTLDDLIKNSKRSGGVNSRGRGRGGRGAAFGPSRRFSNRVFNRAAPYSAVKAPESSWQHDMFAGQATDYSGQPTRLPSLETGTKLYISNLDYGVSNEDIKELFLEVGDLKRYTIHYDRSGRSKGTAEVVFSKRADAMAAVKRYHNVELDGKPMKIDIVGTNAATAAALPAPTSAFSNTNVVPRSGGGQWRVGVGGRFRGAGFGGVRAFARGGRGHGGVGGGFGGEKILAEDLDADLDKYHADAMQLN